jgi:hypothetical protein
VYKDATDNGTRSYHIDHIRKSHSKEVNYPKNENSIPLPNTEQKHIDLKPVINDRLPVSLPRKSQRIPKPEERLNL